MIRYATHTDIPRLVELARLEHAASSWAEVPFDAAHTGESMGQFVSGFGRTALCSDGGYLFGMAQPAGFTKRLVALEYAWFSVDGSGLALLRKFIDWASEMNAVAVVAHDYHGAGKLASILERRFNFKRVGTALSLSLPEA